MNRLQKKIITIALGISNISLCLSAAAVATYAWYTFNANAHVNVASSTMSIEGVDTDESISYEVLKYDDNLKAGVSFTGNDAISNFNLPHYDSYITEKNQYANAIIRAEVKTPLNTTSEELTIDITRLASAFKTAGVIGSKTSNVIQFKAAVYKYKVSGSDEYVVNTASHNSINETSAATRYATASAYFAEKKTPTTFVPIRDSGDGTVIVNRKAEADTITLIPDLPTGLNLTNSIIYIECTYHSTLVNEFINSHAGTEMSYALDGDISLIKFDKKTKTSNTSDATGKYIKVESEATASSGQYLPTYEASANVGKVLKGSLANGSDSIDVNNNLRQVAINNATATEPKSIDSTDTIDDESFAYDRTAKTLKSKAGYYIGNNRTGSNYNIDVSTSPENKTNTITFDDGHPVITSDSGKYLQHYSSGSTDRIRYYNASHPLALYRYTENVAEMPTLVSIAMTGTPSAAQRTFYTEHTFNLNGLEVTATYSDGSTAVVTGSCTFTSPNGVRTLVPEGRTSPTTFTTAQSNKTVNISYSEGAVTLTNALSYTINIIAKEITSLTKSGSLSSVYYYVGETFSSTGVTIYGEYNSGDTHVDITSSVTFGGYNMSTAGTYTVTASYNDLSINVGTIYVRAKALTISPTTKTIAEGESFDITVTYNVNVTITNTPGTGSVSANKSSITYSNANKATTSTTVTVTGVSAGTATLSFSGTGVTTRTCTITITEVPADHFTITPNTLVTGSSYQAYSGSYSTDYNGTGTSSRNWVVTYGGGSNSIGTNSNQASNCKLTNYSKYAVSPVTTSTMAVAVASTDQLYKIKTVSFSYSSGSNLTSTKAYLLYSTDNTAFAQASLSSGSQGMSTTSTGTTYTFELSEAKNGYFALVFTTNATSGEWKINGLSIEFNPISLSSIAISGDCSTKTYNNGDSLSMTGLTVTATFSDGSTSNVTASSTLTSSVNPLTTGTTSVTVTASYTFDGVNKTATKTITGLTVNPVKVSTITLNQTTASIAVSGTVQLSVTAVGPSTADDKTYSWSVYSGSTYASVNSSGLVTGLAAGTAVIRATANDGGGAYAACTVTVTSGDTGYTVSFNANGGSGSMSSVSNVSGSYTLPSNGFTAPTGKSFAGWSVGSNTSTTVYAAGASITVSANTTLYARWTTTSTYTFTTNAWGDSTNSWTSGKAGNQLTSGRGIQVTTGSSGANATTTSSFSLVSQIVVTYSTNASKGAGTIAFQVGSNTASSQSVTTSGGTSDRTLTYSFNPKQTGAVKITVTCTTNSIYVKSVAITYIT